MYNLESFTHRCHSFVDYVNKMANNTLTSQQRQAIFTLTSSQHKMSEEDSTILWDDKAAKSLLSVLGLHLSFRKSSYTLKDLKKLIHLSYDSQKKI